MGVTSFALRRLQFVAACVAVGVARRVRAWRLPRMRKVTRTLRNVRKVVGMLVGDGLLGDTHIIVVQVLIVLGTILVEVGVVVVPVLQSKVRVL